MALTKQKKHFILNQKWYIKIMKDRDICLWISLTAFAIAGFLAMACWLW